MTGILISLPAFTADTEWLGYYSSIRT